MKLLTNTNGIRIALFATFLLFASYNLSAQYKLELEWMKDLERIVSITKSDNNSLLYVAFENLIVTMKTSDGSIVKSDSVDGSYNLIMSKDGKTVVAAGNYGVGLLDPQTFKRLYWNSEKASDYLSLNLNEVQNKFVICGSPSLIWIYDVNTKSLNKELKPIYYENGKQILERAQITDDGKYVIYGYLSYIPSNPSIIHYYVKMIDLEGKLVKDFGETSSTNFTLTNDGKTLIYFMSDAIHFFDLVTMKEIEGIQLKALTPAGIEMSSDGKFMLIGLGEGLMYFDLETKKYYLTWTGGTWNNFKLTKDNSSLFLGIVNTLYKLKFVPSTSIKEKDVRLEFSIQVMGNKLNLSNPQNHQINTLTAYDILGRTYPLSANGNEVDVSGLALGRYFLKVGLADGSFLDFGFVVE